MTTDKTPLLTAEMAKLWMNSADCCPPKGQWKFVDAMDSIASGAHRVYDTATHEVVELGELEALRAAVPQWRPIETAPKDGRKVICSRPMIRPYIAFWDYGNSEWLESSGYAVARDPTHWIPLPAAPTTKEPNE